MDSYAIIQLAGKQYRVAKGDKVTVDRLTHQPGETFKVSDVLLTASKDKVAVGQPTVAKASVTLKVLDNPQGDKVRVAKYRSKSRYRKVYGHRQAQTTLEVVSISA